MGGKFKSSVKKTFNQVHTSEQVKNELQDLACLIGIRNDLGLDGNIFKPKLF